MLGAAAIIAVIALTSGSCYHPPCADYAVEPYPGEPADLAAGTWDVWTDIPTMTGDCDGIEARTAIPELMRADLRHARDGLVHLDLGGVHLEGAAWSDRLYAEGDSATGFIGADGNTAQRSTGVILDAWIPYRDELEGELYVLIDRPNRGACEVEARFGAALLTWTEDAPAVCDESVPADPDAPVQHPDDDGYVDDYGYYGCG